MARSRKEKLKPAKNLSDDLLAFRDKLLSYDSNYSKVVEWLDTAIERINLQLQSGIWPPIWWRYGRIDAEASWLVHSFHRGDSEGFFYADTKTGYVPERDEILANMDGIYQRYKAGRR